MVNKQIREREVSDHVLILLMQVLLLGCLLGGWSRLGCSFIQWYNLNILPLCKLLTPIIILNKSCSRF